MKYKKYSGDIVGEAFEFSVRDQLSRTAIEIHVGEIVVEASVFGVMGLPPGTGCLQCCVPMKWLVKRLCFLFICICMV